MVKINNKILQQIQDEASKKIYLDRVAYSNKDFSAIKKIVLTAEGGKKLIEFMNANRNNLYIFGAGVLGKEFIRTWKSNYSFCAVIDNDTMKQGKDIEQIPIVGLNDIINDINDIAIIIVSKFCHNEIEEQLQKINFTNEKIFNFGKYYNKLNKDQYFDLEELDKEKKERFVDCGALDGKTSINMYEWYKGNVDKIWIFEPDMISAERCRKNLNEINFKNYEIIEKAVYSSKTQVSFESTGNGMAGISSTGNTVVDTISLDEAIGHEKPSFIKMDIEGAELQALMGAKKIIQKGKPKLAISVYHKPEDIDTIPSLLLEYNPEYKFYLRHYSLAMNETVLYAL